MHLAGVHAPTLILSKAQRRALTAAALVAVSAAGAAQLALDDGVAVWIGALPLVALLSWATSLRRAGLVGILGLAAWPLWAALLTPERLVDPVWYVNLALRGLVVGFSVVLAAGWRRTLVRQQEAVRVDPVTGLVSAREFYRLVESELRRALRYEHPFTVVYLCVEGLQAVEQRAGRAAGDDLLRLAGRVVLGETRGSDTVAWLRAGDIGVLMPETGPSAAAIVLTRMCAALDTQLRAQRVQPTVSVGAVTWISSEIAAEQLLQRAYQMLYAAQQGAGDRLRHEVLDTAEVLL